MEDGRAEGIPAAKHWPREFAAALGVLVCGLYLLTLSFGILETPDNLPFVGDLDEVAVGALVCGCLSCLGLDLIGFRARRRS